MSTDFKQLSDSELCTLVYQGGESSNAAFEALYDRHSPRVYLYCRRVMGEVNVLDDVFQETFVRFYKSLLIERNMSNVPGFLLRIARNLCVAEKKKRYNSKKNMIKNCYLQIKAYLCQHQNKMML